ncbi:Uncharacterized protein QJS10_CPA08g01859 [Acorus calamus]|uniref:25S rRNA (uridine-N(3))-methyltransferase BMT5-like domain-containing protein n=1 Tax=Acorus calamus TaxID=4465 RepID=A0AAV9EC07_ACOCL|nr:Uncharacterized protein QJS10_CPA08g01859 [Acorus calamus]
MSDQLLTPKDVQVVRKFNHYESSQKILLVGEGDFSFSLCLARVFGSASNIVATSLDTEGVLHKKHWRSVEHIEELKRLKCEVLHGIDVHNMNREFRLIRRSFDRIIFSFPHAGHYNVREHITWVIE